MWHSPFYLRRILPPCIDGDSWSFCQGGAVAGAAELWLFPRCQLAQSHQICQFGLPQRGGWWLFFPNPHLGVLSDNSKLQGPKLLLFKIFPVGKGGTPYIPAAASWGKGAKGTCWFLMVRNSGRQCQHSAGKVQTAWLGKWVHSCVMVAKVCDWPFYKLARVVGAGCSIIELDTPLRGHQAFSWSKIEIP